MSCDVIPSSLTDGLSSDLQEALPDMAPVTISVLNLVDLAGSERLSQAASDDVDKEKIRQKEVRRSDRK